MAIDLTGIHNVGEFYSHHYLDSLLENDLKGLFAEWKQEDDDTPDKRVDRLATEFFAAKRKAMQTNLAKARFDAPHKIHVKLLEALGYEYKLDTRYMLEGQIVPVLSIVQRDGQEYLWIVETQFPEEDQSPFGHRLSKYQFPKQDEDIQIPEETWEDLIREIFRKDEPPRWLLLFSGRYVYLIDRTKWGYGQYLMFDLDEIFGRRQRDTIRALAALLAKEGLAPEEGVPLHFSLEESSHKHAFGVSKDLKYGLRRSVELLANEYVWYQRNFGKQALFQDDEVAKKLTNEALSYLYRLLFLFYAEARAGELNIVPMKSEAYQAGYSLEMLRDLEQVPLNSPQAQDGYYINHSLQKLFKLLNDGYQPSQMALMTDQAGEQVFQEHGFVIQGLNSPLFDPAKTPMLSKAKFRNIVLQEVIQLLSLSRETKRSKYGRGRISYAQLGINQLGAVYEGLLSYTGFFAQEALYEVKPANVKESDEMGQTYFIPDSELDRYEPDEFIYVEAPDGTKQRKSYPKGTFVFRLAGRDREKSASYYTPEVLTQCVVKYSLKELLKDKTADEILKLTICEPAMGSGAFINEAVNQLADAYLERKQEEFGERIPADDYRHERQKVKYYLATNNAYGVDLNPTAVELAKVSLWLNIIYDGAAVPWFGPRLTVGNSLIGARRQVYAAEDVISGKYKKKAPKPVSLGDGEGNFAPRPAGTVYHWLLPDEDMAAFDKDKVIKELAPSEVQTIKDWRKEFTKKITQAELKNLQALSDQVDSLWRAHLKERLKVLTRTKEEISIWGQAKPEGKRQYLSIAGKEKEFAYLDRPTSPFRRLKLAMDYWCALWFWPIKEAEKLPPRQDFWNELNEIFKGVESDFIKPLEQLDLWGEDKLKQVGMPGLTTPSIQDLTTHYPRLKTVKKVSNETAFNHWELVFVDIFIFNDGFQVTLGNPPWVLPDFNEANLFADFFPIIDIRNYRSPQVAKIRFDLLNNKDVQTEYFDNFVELKGQKKFTGSNNNFPILTGKINTYKCFIYIGWYFGASSGVLGLLHPEGIYDDPKGYILRKEVYFKLCYHFQFQNELKLFEDIGNRNKFSINVYKNKNKNEIGFSSISNLYHPTTVDVCFNHDGVGDIPGIKNSNNNWDLRGHSKRIIKIDYKSLSIFSIIFDVKGTNPEYARLPSVHDDTIVQVVRIFAKQEQRLGNIPDKFYFTPSTFWNETASQDKGILSRSTQFPSNPKEWIISGPHIYVATPIYQTPNENCSSHRDYSRIDLLSMPDDYLSRTNYVRACSLEEYEKRVPIWKGQKITQFYRHVNRGQLSQSGKRTLINAIIPPGAAHINNPVVSISFDSNKLLVKFSSLCSSLPYDFFIKITGKPIMVNNLAILLPIPEKPNIYNLLIPRTLRLNCLNTYYSELWRELYSSSFTKEMWTIDDDRLPPWKYLSNDWNSNTPLRNSFARRQALVEIDVLVAMALGFTLDELLIMYNVQFPVLKKADRQSLFDIRGLKVPVKSVREELIVNEDHDDFPKMVPPFTPVDREADYRQAWAFFEKKLKEENDSA
jgi:hypothetical protein